MNRMSGHVDEIPVMFKEPCVFGFDQAPRPIHRS